MAGVGQFPKPNAIRRNGAPVPHRQLPAEGCTLPVPKWPLEGRAPKVWAQLWATPQADVWHEMKWNLGVARLCLLYPEALKPDARTSLLSEVRILEDSLGLSPRGLASLRWSFAPVEEAAPVRMSARERYGRLSVAE